MKRLLVCAFLCLIASVQAVAQDRATPEAAVRTFLAAFQRGDIRQAATCVKGVQMSPAQMDAFAQEVKKEPVSFAISAAKTTLTGASATVTGHVAVKSAKEQKSQTFATQVNLVSSTGTWLIVPNAARAQQDKAPDMVNGLAYMLTQPKVLNIAKGAAEATACLSNIKQLSVAVLMLVQDSDEVLKLNPATFKKSLMPYTKSASVFSCPTGGASSYAFNANLSGVHESKIGRHAETVLIYEAKMESSTSGMAAERPWVSRMVTPSW